MDVIDAVQSQVDALSDDPTRDELWAIVKLGVPMLMQEAQRLRGGLATVVDTGPSYIGLTMCDRCFLVNRPGRTHCQSCSEPLEQPTEAVSALAAIAAERRRQISQEGWSAEHDDEHRAGELAAAASEYATAAFDAVNGHLIESNPIGWPWAREWWKPSEDPLRNLEKAGALILAEYERLLRSDRRSYSRLRHAVPELASGTHLDKLGALFDFKRLPGEPDENYRARLLDMRLRQLGGAK